MVTEQAFRDVMAGVCAAVTVVTTAGDGPYGTTVSAFAALSLRPPMVTVALDRGSALLARVLRARRFGVNVLGHRQDSVAIGFAAPAADRFAAVRWRYDHGLPRIDQAPGWLVCELARAVDGGDHLLLLGDVVEASTCSEIAPLIYGHRVFGTHSRFAHRPRRPIADMIAACAH
jgi:flavin reductase (DIM6/NTAB) family NADH-FMN oxidoreductase RutF